MTESLQLVLTDEPVRFTHGGKLFVLDAIAAIAPTDSPAALWEDFKSRYPEETEQHCDYLDTTEAGQEPVCDSDGWEALQELLFDYMIDTAEAQNL